uniref:Vesicle associated membrane protein 4 n=1 Tax=Rousettus aegyptiacus TaxID=9407 RepID=A0A7J8BIQ1_ROUAE|nr:vesicle associated membrane protein 4 [Rousettus aegyptiacus]
MPPKFKRHLNDDDVTGSVKSERYARPPSEVPMRGFPRHGSGMFVLRGGPFVESESSDSYVYGKMQRGLLTPPCAYITPAFVFLANPKLTLLSSCYSLIY